MKYPLETIRKACQEGYGYTLGDLRMCIEIIDTLCSEVQILKEENEALKQLMEAYKLLSAKTLKEK